ncbi:energy transducer TonB [bacterium]|nr:MAG: energy transducer TonB [bacterium]
MKSRKPVLLIISLLLCAGLCAQTVAEKPGVVQELLSEEDQLAFQDQQAKKQAPPDYVKYDQPPEVVKQVHPDYPNEALASKAEGTVWVNVWIDESGNVVEAKVMKSSTEVFNQAAMAAAKQWTFKPAITNGKPVAVWVMVPFRFKLSEGKGAAPSMGVPVKAPDMKSKAKNLREEMPPADYVPYEKPPEAIKQMPAKYPEAAKKDKVEGTVWLKTLVDVQGKVTKVEIQKSDAEMLNQAAVDAVKQWVFKPAVMEGKPVAVWVSIPFRFKLASDHEKPFKK